MLHKKLFYFLLCVLFWAPFAMQADDRADIDKRISELKTERQVVQMQAYVASGNAQQYLGQSWVDYKAAIRKQELCEQRLKEIDAEIQELEDQRAKLSE